MIEVKNLKKHFIAKNSMLGDEKELVHAVNGIDFRFIREKRWDWSANPEVVNPPQEGWF